MPAETPNRECELFRGVLGRRVKRRGFVAQAAFSTAWRLSWIAAAVPICTEYGVCSAIPE